ncbi:MAG: hypothetical protein IPG87_21020 [Saprospiraceae bacterium]|nr:hypothetical protein [Candidatus Vicinibacter affinis]
MRIFQDWNNTNNCNQAANHKNSQPSPETNGRDILISKSCQRKDNNDCQGKDEGINEIEIFAMEGKLVMMENVKL